MARGDAKQLSPVCALVAERSGSSLSTQQVARLRELLARRLAGKSEEEHVAYLKSPQGAAELAELMSAIAVHKTDLFRDEIQLNAFDAHVLTPLVRQSTRPLAIWSAGCATGEEVATLLILLAEAGAHPKSTVLGTDISETALRQARDLVFAPYMVRRVAPELLEKYFRPTSGGYALVRELRDRANFFRHNLMDFPYPDPPNGQGFDVIFCRNVLIYFTESAFDRVVNGLAERLKPGGTLVLSAAEPILKPSTLLSTLRCDQAFFYVRDRSGKTPAKGVPAARPVVAYTRTMTPSGEMPAVVIPSRPPLEPEAAAPDEDPLAEATRLFEQVLDWAASGETEEKTEQGLRRCLYLDPHFAQARYLLGIMLEQRGEKANAASEYRRALSALEEERARPVPFFLNEERLKMACQSALRRLGYP